MNLWSADDSKQPKNDDATRAQLRQEQAIVPGDAFRHNEAAAKDVPLSKTLKKKVSSRSRRSMFVRGNSKAERAAAQAFTSAPIGRISSSSSGGPTLSTSSTLGAAPSPAAELAATGSKGDTILSPATNVTYYTRAEIQAHHSTQTSCWIVIQNKVYDVTLYQTDHPGGGHLISDHYAGRDATLAFYGHESGMANGEFHAHTNRARKKLESLYVGDVHPSDRTDYCKEIDLGKISGGDAKQRNVAAISDRIEHEERDAVRMDLEKYYKGELSLKDMGIDWDNLGDGKIQPVKKKKPSSLSSMMVETTATEFLLRGPAQPPPPTPSTAPMRSGASSGGTPPEEVMSRRPQKRLSAFEAGLIDVSDNVADVVEGTDESHGPSEAVETPPPATSPSSLPNPANCSCIDATHEIDLPHYPTVLQRGGTGGKDDIEEEFPYGTHSLKGLGGVPCTGSETEWSRFCRPPCHRSNVPPDSCSGLDAVPAVPPVSFLDTGRDLAAKALLATRLFPELEGELMVLDDARGMRGTPPGNTTSVSCCERGTFHLRGGWLRRIVSNCSGPLRVGISVGKQSPPTFSDEASGSSVAVDGAMAVNINKRSSNSTRGCPDYTEHCIRELPDARMIDPLEVAATPQFEIGSDAFQCCGWTLRAVSPTGSDGTLEEERKRNSWTSPICPSTSEWQAAINASIQVRSSSQYTDARTFLSAVCGSMASSLRSQPPSCPENETSHGPRCTPALDIVEWIERQFDFEENWAIEFANALINSSFLVHAQDGMGETIKVEKDGVDLNALYVFSDEIIGAMCSCPPGQEQEVVATNDPNGKSTDIDARIRARQTGTRSGATACATSGAGSVYCIALVTQEELLNHFDNFSGTEEYQDQIQMQKMLSYASMSQKAKTPSKRRSSLDLYRERVFIRRSFDQRHMVDTLENALDPSGAHKGNGNHNPLRSSKTVCHSHPCSYTQQIVPYMPEAWPQHPLLLRPSPGSSMRVKGIRFASSQKYMFLPGSGFCCGCTLPINTGSEVPGKSLVTDFETDLFGGTILVRVRGCRDAQAGANMDTDNPTSGHFGEGGTGQTFQIVVRGRFRREGLPISECMTGQVFDAPPGKLPPRLALRAALNLLTVLSPVMRVTWVGNGPWLFLGPLASAAQSIIVSEPDSTEEEGGKDHHQPVAMGHQIESPNPEPADPSSSLLSAVGGIRPSQSRNTAIRRKVRKKAFDKLGSKKDKSVTFRTDREYTFVFFHHLPRLDDFSLDLGSMGCHDMSMMLNGQPLKIMAGHEREGQGGGAKSLDCLWSFDLWHEKLFAAAKMQPTNEE